MLQSLVLLVFHVFALSESGKPQRKLDYEIDPEYQNLIDSQQGTIPIPSFTLPLEYFVYGGIFGLTEDYSGKPSLSGYQEMLAMKCAIDDINAISKVRGQNTTYYYNILNSQGSPSVSMRAGVELLSAGVPVTIGPSISDSAVAVASLYAPFNITILSGSTTANILSRRDLYGTYFRTIPPDQAMADVVTDLMLYFNWTLVTPIYTRNTYGVSGQAEFQAQAAVKGILVTCGRFIPPGQTTGLQNTINCLSTSQSSVVILWMGVSDAFNVISEFYKSELLPDITFIATDGWGDTADVESFLNGQVPVSYLEGSLSVIPKRGDQSNFINCVSKIRPDDQNLPGIDNYWQVGLRCILSDDNNISFCPEELNDRLSFPNISCRCTDEDNLRLMNAEFRVNYIYDAVFAVYNAIDQIENNCTGISDALDSDFCSLGEFNTAELQKVVQISEFEGLTGQIGFIGNDPIDVSYQIWQRRSDGINILVGISVLNTTGSYNITLPVSDSSNNANATSDFALAIDNSRLVFKNDKTPISAIVPSEITFSDPLGIVTLIFILIALLLSFAFSLYFFRNRNEKVIKKTSPFFSQLMLLGIILCVTSQIFWDVSQSTFTCIVKVWLLAIGFGLIMGNLLAKTYRIFKIFNNAKVTSLVIRDIDLLKFTAVVLLMEVILLCVYCFAAGVPEPVAIQSTSDSLLKIVKCQVPSSLLQIAGTITLLTLNFLLVFAAVIIAYLTRNVDSAFNESKYIGYTVYIYLLVTIILLPLYYTAGDSASSNSRQFIIRSIAVLVPMFFTLFALFLPKIYLVYKTKKAEKKALRASQQASTGRIIEVSSVAGQEATATSSVAGGAYSKALYSAGGLQSTVTESKDESEYQTDGAFGPRSESRASQIQTEGVTSSASGNSSRPAATTTDSNTASNEYSGLISSLSKRRK